MEVRVLHIIDSLSVGGAERVAVNLVNALNDSSQQAWLCVTRKEGPLKKEINNAKKYIFLQRSNTFDIQAIRRLILFIKQNQINIVHAHSSSFFIGLIAKLFTKVSLIWHDHDGNSEKVSERKTFPLLFFSYFFDGIVVVNENLRCWALAHLHTGQGGIAFIPNFPFFNKNDFDQPINQVSLKTQLTIICLANLREQKDHLNLLKAILILNNNNKIPNFKVQLVGNDLNDNYSTSVKTYILDHLINNVDILGTRTDISFLLQNADIGVLSSESEGFPVSLMEYGLYGVPVVCTAVGECSTILNSGEFGLLVPPKDAISLADALAKLLVSEERRHFLGNAFRQEVLTKYTPTRITEQLVQIYQAALS